MRFSKICAFFIYCILLIGCFSVFHVINTIHASEATFYVGGSGPGNYTTIQAAVTAAAGGDTIYVYQNTPDHSTYSENIVINKNLNLIGEDKNTTIIDGGYNDRVIRVANLSSNEIECSISGFTIRNAGGTGNACIAMSYSQNGNIWDNIILNSQNSDGIKCDHCTGITIQDNTIASNENGNGIYLISSSINNIYNNIIQTNFKGINLYYSSNNFIYNNKVIGNQIGISVVSPSSNNIFYFNDFIQNDINAQDADTNSWSYTGQGNYWGDFLSNLGYPNYYIISGQGNNQDLYPLGYFKLSAVIQSISQTTAPFGTMISFSGNGVEPNPNKFIEGYRWESNKDDLLSTTASFSTSSLTVGVHTISFTVTNNVGDPSDPVNATVTITQPQISNPKPVAHIVSINPSQALFGSPVYFYGYGNDDGNIIAYKWNSSIDGVFGAQQSFDRSNLSVGNHLISFQVMDNQGMWSDEVAQSLVVVSTSSPSNLPPVAIAGGPYTTVVNTSISFDASQSHDQDPSGSIVSYVWSFGDETTADGVQVEHMYAASGNYTVTLQVTDNNGTKTTATTQASVYKPGELPPDNGDGNGHTETPDNGIVFDIPWMIVVPVAGVLIFVGIIIGFFSWMKRS